MKRFIALLLCIVFMLPLAAINVGASEADDKQIPKNAILSALYEADIASLRLALEEKLITSAELTQYYLDRINQYDEPFNCFITICDDALEIAAQRDVAISDGTADGLLFGVPVVIKDNMDLEGYHTTNGFKKAKDQIAKSNADVVDYLLAEGAVIIAKANMSTEAQNALRSYSQAVGETKNAYNRYLAAGGSSGGSAVSTSLNFTAASLGTDTNSSLRIPAALAGCVSLRPTFGMIPVDGIKKLNGTRDVPGAITRTVYDQAIMLDVLTERKNDYTGNLDKNALQGMRIGVLKQLSYATTKTGVRKEANIDKEVAAAFEQAIEELRRCGAEVVEVSMSNLFTLSDKTFQNNKQASKTALYNAFEELLQKENVSAVVYPTYLSTPIRSGRDAEGKYWNVYDQTNINNCRTLAPSAGIPEITVPIGLHSLGAGIGMEIASLKNSEQLLLNIAYSYTSAYDHRQLPAGAPNAYHEDYLGTVSDLVYMRDHKDDPEQTNDEIELLPDIADDNDVAINKRNALEYWPFAVLAVLLICLLYVIRRIYIRRMRRKKRAAQRKRQRVH